MPKISELPDGGVASNETVFAGVNSSVTERVTLPINSKTLTEGGFFDYNDAATSITPISCTSDEITKLTNDGLGSFTNKTYKPNTVTDIWDATANAFDFSDLVLGDQVIVRLDVTPITTSPNTDFTLGITLGVGASPYTLNFEKEKPYKSADTHDSLIVMAHFYMGDTNTLDNPAEIHALFDDDASITVNGWYIRVN